MLSSDCSDLLVFGACRLQVRQFGIAPLTVLVVYLDVGAGASFSVASVPVLLVEVLPDERVLSLGDVGALLEDLSLRAKWRIQ
jgi:hypothetical protein